MDNSFDELLAKVLGIGGVNRFDDATPMEDLPNLDSLRFMNLINAIEAQFGVLLTPEAMMDVEKVGDLRALVNAASVTAD